MILENHFIVQIKAPKLFFIIYSIVSCTVMMDNNDNQEVIGLENEALYLTQLILKQRNPFLAHEFKQYIVKTISSPQQRSNFQITQIFKQRSQRFFRLINEYSQNERIKREIQTKLENFKPLEQCLWKEAKVLFNTPTIEKLTPDQKMRLLKIAKQDNSNGNRITLFLKQNSYYDSLKQQLNKKQKIQNICFLIVESRPKLSLVNKILLGKYQSILGHYLNIKQYEGENKIRGQIVEISDGKKNEIILKLKYQQIITELTLTLNQSKGQNLSKGYVETISFQSWQNFNFQVQLRNLVDNRITQSELRKCKLKYSTCNTKNCFLPQGIYSFKSTKLLNDSNFQLQFKSQEKTFKCEVKQQYQILKIIYFDDEQKIVMFEQFARGYQLYKPKVNIFKYSSFQNNQECFILEDQSSNPFAQAQKVKQIAKLKTNLVDSLMNQYKSIYQKLFDALIQNRLAEHLAEKPQFQAKIQKICQLSQEANCFQTRDQVLREVLPIANYKMFIDKQGSLETTRIIEFLTQSFKCSKQIKGKEIVLLYGNTGSGKSTYVNYLIDVELEDVNRYGDNVFEIRQQSLAEMRENGTKFAVIGQMISLSQTTYAQGYALQDYDEVLVDLPGFNDNRGDSFTICTNYSMDGVIDACRQIRAIVLVIAHDSLFSNRANDLVEVIQQLEHRFPSLLDKQSAVYKHFYIQITKYPPKLQFRDVEKKLDKLCEETQQQNIQNNLQRHRLKIFKLLKLMFSEKKIGFIDLKITVQRTAKLNKYLSTQQPRPKQLYNPIMKNAVLVKKFTDQIFNFASAWSKKILQRYLHKIPEEIKQKETQRSNKENEIKNIQVISDQKEKSIKKGQQIWNVGRNILQQESNKLDELKQSSAQNVCQKYKQLVQLQMFCQAKDQPQFQEANKLIHSIIRDLVEKHTQEQQALDATYIKLSDKYLRRIEIEKKVATIKQTIQNLEHELIRKPLIANKVQQIVSQSSKVLYKQPYRLNQSIIVDGQPHIIGRQNFTLNSTIILPRDSFYKIECSKDFDPKQIIEQTFYTKNWRLNINEKITAAIQSHNTEIINLQFKRYGKEIEMQIKQKFTITTDPKQLPFLKMTEITKGDYFHKCVISDKKSELAQLLQQDHKVAIQLEKTQKQVLRQGQFLKHITKQLVNISIKGILISLQHQFHKFYKITKQISQQTTQNAEEYRKKIVVKKQQYIAAVKDKLKQLTDQIAKQKNDIQRFSDYRKALKDDKQRIQERISQLKKDRRRLAYLIKNQHNKQIPQNLKLFIEQAQKLNKQQNKNNIREQLNSFEEYKLKYGQLIKRLPELDVHLENKKEG